MASIRGRREVAGSGCASCRCHRRGWGRRRPISAHSTFGATSVAQAPVKQSKGAFSSKLSANGNTTQGIVSGVAPSSASVVQRTDTTTVPLSDTLSAEGCEAMLSELLQAYNNPGFKQALQQAHASGLGIQALGPLVLQVQAPVLQKYGFKPSAEGVELMKHTIQRRVAEGHTEVERLANEARRILGIEPLPDRSSGAEEILANTLVTKTGSNLLEDESWIEIAKARISHLLAAGDICQSAADVALQMIDDGQPMPVCFATTGIARSGLPGSLLSRPSKKYHEEVPILEKPNADDFFNYFVMENQPAILRGVLDEENFSPLRDFPDFDYLRRTCGHRRVLVKSLANVDRQGRPVFVSDPELKLPLVDFLDSVERFEEDGSRCAFYLGKVPLNAELPELAEAVEQAPMNPMRAYGNCFGDLIPAGVFTYFGCAQNTTAVHYDCHENLLIVLCGTKKLHVYAPSDTPYLYPVKPPEFSRSAVVPFTAHEDLSPDLQETYKLLPRARPIEVNLKAGDIFYLPVGWWHCVTAGNERNMILNWWMGTDPRKTARDGSGRKALMTC